MIFHTIKTITVGQFGEIVSFKDINLIKRINIPVFPFMLKMAYSRLLNEWNNISNKDKIEAEINKNKTKLKHLTQINIHYKIMIDMLKLSALYGLKKPKELLIKQYIYIYKKEPKTQADFEKIYKDIDLKIRRYKQMYGNGEEENNNVDFEQLIINIEMILAPVTIRDKKLYTLPKYIEMASKKIKENG